MKKRIESNRVWEVLEAYYTLREGGWANLLNGSDPNASAAFRDPSCPGKLMFQCDVGCALQRLAPDQRYQILHYFWTRQAYELGETLRLQARFYATRQVAKSDRQRTLRQLQLDFGRKTKKCEAELIEISKNRKFKEGLENIADSISRIVSDFMYTRK